MPLQGWAQGVDPASLEADSEKHPGPCKTVYDSDADGEPDSYTEHEYKDKKRVEDRKHSGDKKTLQSTRYYSYDDDGRIGQTEDYRGKKPGRGEVHDFPREKVEYAYNADGRLERKESTLYYPGGGITTTTTYAYDANGELTADTRKSSGKEFKSTYTYKDGRLVQVKDPGLKLSMTYAYDSSGRLLEHTTTDTRHHKAFVVKRYTYDKKGNLVQISEDSVKSSELKDKSLDKKPDSTWTYDYSCWE